MDVSSGEMNPLIHPSLFLSPTLEMGKKRGISMFLARWIIQNHPTRNSSCLSHTKLWVCFENSFCQELTSNSCFWEGFKSQEEIFAGGSIIFSNTDEEHLRIFYIFVLVILFILFEDEEEIIKSGLSAYSVACYLLLARISRRHFYRRRLPARHWLLMRV